jgi:4-hydroxythreonine-4-phosphate dehydrogenase
MPSPAQKTLPAIALTIGEPAGIGPEVIAQTLRDPRLPKGFRFEVLGAEKAHSIAPGKLTRASARIALAALEEAAQGCRNGRFAAMVTGPVHKEALARIAPDFVGQTEFLARQCHLPDDAAVMVLTDPKLTVALCTNHCSLRQALDRLTSARIVYVTQQVAQFLQKRGVAQPRLALAGVNPHAGEHGLFGDEEERLLQPALDRLHREKINIVGPQSPDAVFLQARHGAFDAVICTYHDQGLIPFKLLAFESGVNLTLGLPIIRTSPDHGTALDIAGRGVAGHRSMLAAVQLACRLARNGLTTPSSPAPRGAAKTL